MKLELSLRDNSRIGVSATIEEGDSVTLGSQTYQEFDLSELSRGNGLERLEINEELIAADEDEGDDEEFFSLDADSNEADEAENLEAEEEEEVKPKRSRKA